MLKNNRRMVDRALHRLAALVLARAIIALAVVVASGLQPVLFAAGNVDGHHGGNGLMLSATAYGLGPDAHATQGHHHRDDQAQAGDEGHSTEPKSEVGASTGTPHDHSSEANDKRCELHCAPVQVIAVEAWVVTHVPLRDFEGDVLTALRHLELAQPVRPPERQI